METEKEIGHTNPRNKTKLIVIALFLLALALSGLAAWRGYTYYQYRQFVSQIPASIRESVPFPIYIPEHLKVQQDSINYSEGNLIFTVGNDKSKLIVTEQAKAASFDINKFAGITEPTAISSPLGSGVRGKVANRTIAILSTDKTLITFVAPSDSALDEMNLAISTLAKVD